MNSAAYQTPEELAATLLPCFWIYAVLGKELTQKAVSPNPYDNWLKDYRNPDFDKSTKQMIDLTNRLAAKASPALRQKMLDAFTMASRMELNFWDSAYKLENWQ
ncbi:transcriptional regulator [Lasius niger]|uniref:Transcriptional regulator n=1 Tax=Lasius niger TaxID=67767 RepID=A0A0J7JVX7_LASNI|nr:transcriptional regulator [Lasius niger]